MTQIARYLTHPQVAIDPHVPVPDWGLSEIGRARIERLAAAKPWAETTKIVSSAERKAVETAEILQAAWGGTLQIRDAQHENDRSATGFLPPDKFEAAADAFFATPTRSFRGWETAEAAQKRITTEVAACLSDHSQGDILFVGHGAVGTLLYCALSGQAIDRRYDQPGGGGNVIAFTLPQRQVQHHWRPLESWLTKPDLAIGGRPA
ncbi:histidine phosphatase family protein [Gymnodinialimonas sp. 2305UL16-5]|uniref:histidine phosphatase family protein n=1 Tax=Gymnodinialimonas mytili TaxID=3126503 RepID=UPI00309B259C